MVTRFCSMSHHLTANSMSNYAPPPITPPLCGVRMYLGVTNCAYRNVDTLSPGTESQSLRRSLQSKTQSRFCGRTIEVLAWSLRCFFKLKISSFRTLELFCKNNCRLLIIKGRLFNNKGRNKNKGLFPAPDSRV